MASQEYTDKIVDHIVYKVEKYINQLIPMPSCHSDRPRAEEVRREVRRRLSQTNVGPSQLK